MKNLFFILSLLTFLNVSNTFIITTSKTIKHYDNNEGSCPNWCIELVNYGKPLHDVCNEDDTCSNFCDFCNIVNNNNQCPDICDYKVTPCKFTNCIDCFYCIENEESNKEAIEGVSFILNNFFNLLENSTNSTNSTNLVIEEKNNNLTDEI